MNLSLPFIIIFLKGFLKCALAPPSIQTDCRFLLCRDSASSSVQMPLNSVMNGSTSGSGGSSSTNPIAGWLVERASPSQVCALNKLVENFCDRCHQVSGRQSAALRSAFKMQVCTHRLQ